MKLYSSPRSPFVRKVVVAIHELGLADRIELVPTVVAMDQPNEGMLAKNPLGKIPALELADGTALYDSTVIIDYLDRKAGCRLIPAAGDARDWVLVHHALANGLMDILVLWRNERDKPSEQQSTGWIANFGRKTEAALATLEKQSPELGHKPFGLAHIAIAVVLAYLDFRFEALTWRGACPKLAAWYAKASQRPSMLATRITA